MATTTNYSWTTPDDTALVKDGAAAIRTLGSSIDTTTKALNPSTTLGDIEYRSSTANTNTRLGIGTSGQVLTVAGGVPSWATAVAGGMTQLATSTPSGVSSVSFSSIASTYKHLLITFSDIYGTVDEQNLLFRFNGDTGSNYSYYQILGTGSTATMNSSQGTDNARFSSVITTASSLDNRTNGFLWIYNYAQTGYSRQIAGSAIGYMNAGSARLRWMNGLWKNTANALDQVDMSLGSGNFSAGKITLYGVS